MITMQNVRKTYGNFTFEMSMELPEGQILGLIGKNGAGKSTAIKLILGLCRAPGSLPRGPCLQSAARVLTLCCRPDHSRPDARSIFTRHRNDSRWRRIPALLQSRVYSHAVQLLDPRPDVRQRANDHSCDRRIACFFRRPHSSGSLLFLKYGISRHRPRQFAGSYFGIDPRRYFLFLRYLEKTKDQIQFRRSLGGYYALCFDRLRPNRCKSYEGRPRERSGTGSCL